MRARVSLLCLCLCVGRTVSADDVPAPPSESGMAPEAIFSDDYVSPIPDETGTVSPSAVYAQPVSATTVQPRRYYYVPSSNTPETFQFAGYNGGLTMAIGGTVDELFNAGVRIGVETGWQYTRDDGMFNDIAFTVGLANQTLWAKDQRSIVLPDGTYRGLETLSISTVKSGVYIGRSLGAIDVFFGGYGKLGAAILNEDVEFFDPLVEYTPVQDFKQTALAGGGGLEVGVALVRGERSSLGVVAGVEALYLDTFDTGANDWTLFTTTGLQYEMDITDGLFSGDGFFRSRNRCPRERRRGKGRRCR